MPRACKAAVVQGVARAWTAHAVLLGVGQFVLQVRDLQVGIAQPRVQLRSVVVPIVLPWRLRPCSRYCTRRLTVSAIIMRFQPSPSHGRMYRM